MKLRIKTNFSGFIKARCTEPTTFLYRFNLFNPYEEELKDQKTSNGENLYNK